MHIPALPVPAHADFLASLTAVKSVASSRWVSETSAASKSEVRMKSLARSLQHATLHCKILVTTSKISSFRFLPVCLRPHLALWWQKKSPPVPAASVTALHLRLTAHNVTVLPTIMKQRQIITRRLSVRKTDCRLRRNRQGTNRMTAGVMDVLTER